MFFVLDYHEFVELVIDDSIVDPLAEHFQEWKDGLLQKEVDEIVNFLVRGNEQVPVQRREEAVLGVGFDIR